MFGRVSKGKDALVEFASMGRHVVAALESLEVPRSERAIMTAGNQNGLASDCQAAHGICVRHDRLHALARVEIEKAK